MCLFGSSKVSFATEDTESFIDFSRNRFHTVQTSSLLPSTFCSSQGGLKKKRSVNLVYHKHGPCSKLNEANTPPSHTQILLQDEARVNSIESKFSKAIGLNKVKGSKVTLPAKSGSTVGSGNYLVTVGLGTPKKQLSLIFDTGSDLTWTQCQPCLKSCYQQQEPIFDSSLSSSYTNISCNSNMCTDLTSATGNTPSCSVSTCVYGIQYGDSSFSVGFLAKERLTLTSSDVIPNFLFGCGQNNQGLFRGAAGLLGLGRNKISLVEQTAQKYGKYFSYCLPSKTSSTGHLTFGKTGASRNINFTPLSRISQGTSFYGIDITAISVGGRKLHIAASIFSNPGALIDSGTVITRLPPTAYSKLKDAFRQLMTKYPLGQQLSILDTCYDFSNYSSISVPKISISFSGDVEVGLDISGIFYANGITQVCLAFAPNQDDSSVIIYGNVQQQTQEVVYDLAGGRIGFAPNACS